MTTGQIRKTALVACSVLAALFVGASDQPRGAR